MTEPRSRRGADRLAADYHRGKRAETEVGRRLTMALDRLSASRGDNVAQVFHAVHAIQYGYMDANRDRPSQAPDVTFGQLTAEELVATLSWLLTLAYNAKFTVGEAEALPDD